MARRTCRPPVTAHQRLTPVRRTCSTCQAPLVVAYHTARTVTTLERVCRLHLVVRRCRTVGCPRARQPYRPEAEGAWALPHGEFGLDVIALVGTLRYRQHHSVPDIHAELQRRGVAIAERTVTHLLARYEELVAVRLADQTRLQRLLTTQGHVILAIDGLQPLRGQEVLHPEGTRIRDCLSGEVLLARSLASTREADLADLLREVQAALPVPIHGVASDGQPTIRLAVRRVLPDVPHQLCHYHYLKEAAKPITAADRHAQTMLKQYVRGLRPIEQRLDARDDTEAAVSRAYCHAVRSALTDDGKPPLKAPGLVLHDRLTAIHASLDRVRQKKRCHRNWCSSRPSSHVACSSPLTTGRPCTPPIAGSCGRRRSWQTLLEWMGQPSRQTTAHCSRNC